MLYISCNTCIKSGEVIPLRDEGSWLPIEKSPVELTGVGTIIGGGDIMPGWGEITPWMGWNPMPELTRGVKSLCFLKTT